MSTLALLGSPVRRLTIRRSSFLYRLIDLASNFRYNSEYTGSVWSEPNQSHTLTLQRPNGETYNFTADVLISANGPLSTPLIPKLPGLSSFKGTYFHNLRWKADYDFEGKKVAVVGNGSSGIQLVVSARRRRSQRFKIMLTMPYAFPLSSPVSLPFPAFSSPTLSAREATSFPRVSPSSRLLPFLRFIRSGSR